jgi:predicted acylesterase/phospholipase RssA
VDSILNFTTTKGFETGKKLNLFIKKYIKEKTGNENITFLQIQEKYNIKLQIGVTNLTKYKFELFNVDTTPDIPIEKAISASIAIPFVFEPIIIGDDIFCDGGLLDNLPIENVIDMDILLHKDKQETNKDTKDTKDIKNKDKQETDKDKQETNHTTENPSNTNNDLNIIGVYLISKIPIINKDNYKAIGISQYINLITHTLSKNIISKKQNYENINKNKYKIISIEIPCDIMSFIKINATHQDIDNIINIAYTITKNDLNF